MMKQITTTKSSLLFKSTINNPETNKVIQESMPLDLKILFLCNKLTEVFKMPLSNILRKCNRNAFLMPY